MNVTNHYRLCYLLLILILPLTVKAGEVWVYKWQDDHGVTQYTQYSPENIESELIRITTLPVRELPAPEVTQEINIETDTKSDSNTDEETELSALDKEKEAFQKNCLIAKNNKTTYENNPGRRFTDADGNVIRLTEEDRQARILESQAQIDFYCK